MTTIAQQILEGLKATTLPEGIAVIAGIISVYFEQREKIWLYPIGLINTLLFVYLSFKAHLLGEASVNIFYTIISVYGWIAWSKRSRTQAPMLQISFSTRKEWIYQLSFFAGCYAVIFAALTAVKHYFTPGAIPWADAFASAAAYTGMLLLARKKVESWYWWIATNLASIPLYLVKGYAFSSLQFLIFSVMSVIGLIAWTKKATLNHGLRN